VVGFLGLAPVFAANTMVEAFGFPATLAIIAAGGLCASLGGGFVYRARRWRALQPDRTPAPDSRAPVLYLRAFAVDEKLASAPALSSGQPWITQSAEENLVGVLDEIGPVTALGKPGEPLSKLGARRLYTEDEAWQQTVLDHMKRRASC
jgi:hypothetical protein